MTADAVYVLEHPRAPLGILGDIGIGPYLRVRKIGPDGREMTLATRWGRYSQPLAIATVLIVGAVLLIMRSPRAYIATATGAPSLKPAISGYRQKSPLHDYRMKRGISSQRASLSLNRWSDTEQRSQNRYPSRL